MWKLRKNKKTALDHLKGLNILILSVALLGDNRCSSLKNLPRGGRTGGAALRNWHRDWASGRQDWSLSRRTTRRANRHSGRRGRPCLSLNKTHCTYCSNIHRSGFFSSSSTAWSTRGAWVFVFFCGSFNGAGSYMCGPCTFSLSNIVL